MPLAPTGLLGCPTAPGHRTPLFYTKLKTSFYKRFRVTFPDQNTEGAARCLQHCLSSLSSYLAPWGEGTVQINSGLAFAVLALPPHPLALVLTFQKDVCVCWL